MSNFRVYANRLLTTLLLIDLTTPGFKKGSGFDRLSGIDSEDGGSEANGSGTGSDVTARTTTIVQVPGPSTSASYARPTYVEPTLLGSAPSIKITAPSSMRTERKPLDKTSLTTPAMLSPGDRQGNGKRRGPASGGVGLPARPRLEISGPKPSPLDGNLKEEQPSSAFERPRPPPLVLQGNGGGS